MAIRIETADGDGWTIYDVRCPSCKRFVSMTDCKVEYRELREALEAGREPSYGDCWPTLTVFASCKAHGQVEASWASL